MSMQAMTWVWEHAEAKGTALLMLLAIADHANDEGRCWPSIARLAHRCRIEPRQAKRLVAQLQEEGYLDIVRGGGKGQTSIYVLKGVGGDTVWSPKGVTEDTLSAKGDISEQKVSSGAQRVSPVTAKGVMQGQKVSSGASKGDMLSHAREEPNEPSIEPKEEPPVEPSLEPLARTAKSDCNINCNINSNSAPTAAHWAKLKSELHLSLPEATYYTWLHDAEFVQAGAGTFTIRVASPFAASWIQTRLATRIENDMRHISGAPCKLIVEHQQQPEPALTW